jgi:hypothetical protein
MSFSKSMILAIAMAIAARADFSYTSTRKGTAAGQAGEVTKHYLKGQKMAYDSGNRVILVDFEAQTVTTIHPAQKTYSVAKFGDLGQSLQGSNIEITADVKETGQKKAINGFNASEVVMTMQVETPQTQQAGLKMQMEMDIWFSPDVPGSQEQKAFYQKNMGHFPWAAIAQGGNPGMQKAMIDLQRKMAALNGVPVLEVVRMKPAGGSGAGAAGGNDAQAAQVQQGMAQARARLEEMQKQGGPGAAAAAQALARMGGAAGGGSMFESTIESSNFSTSPVPDSVFAIPAGFNKVDK